MITVDRYWKKEVAKAAERLALRKKQKRWTESSTAALEKDVFSAAFSVRKLSESGKLASAAKRYHVVTVFYPKLSAAGVLPIPHFTHAYDFGAGVQTSISTIDLMNQFIHSYHFSAFVPVNTFMTGIFFASDRDRKNKLWYVTVPELEKVFRLAGR